MNELSFNPNDFSGCVRLFPIPQLVMFPHVMQSLHVFEPRYRSLLSDALEDDSLIAIPVLSSEVATPLSPPPLEPVACLTKIISHDQLADERSNILVAGVARIHLSREMAPWEMYRQARAEILPDRCASAPSDEEESIRAVLVTAFKNALAAHVEDLACLDGLLDREVSLAVVTDLIAHTLELDWAIKVQLLAELDVGQRAAKLREILVAPDASHMTAREYLPSFSAN